MRLSVLLFLSSCCFAQDASVLPAPESEQWLSGSFDFGYRWRTGVSGSMDTYRSIVNLGSGPKFIGADLVILDPGKLFFDRMTVRADGWGGEPYSTLQIGIKKNKLYNFNGGYRDIAYFNNLASFADPLLSQGILLSQQAQDTHRRITTVQLDFLPFNWLIPYLAFDGDSDTGTGVNAFVDGGNEYAVPTTIRNSLNNYRGGARIQLRRFHLTLEQGGTTFKDDQNVYTSPGTNLGNNPVPLLGQTLDLTHLSQAYGIRGASIYSKALLTTTLVPWADLYGQFLYSRPDNQVHYQDFATGNLADLSQLLFYTAQQYLLNAQARLPHKSASIGLELRPLHNIRIVESWLTDRLNSSSSASALQTNQQAATLSTTALLLGYAETSNYNRQETDVIFTATPQLTLTAGYRYVWGEANDLISPVAELTGFEMGKLRQNVGIARASYRPGKKLSFNTDLEIGRAGGNYFRTSLYNYQNLKLRARYRLTPALQLTASGNLLNNNNPTAGVANSYFAHQETLSIDWSPTALKGWDFQGTYSRSTLKSEIDYLIPELLQPERDLYRDNSHSVTFFLEGNLPKLAGATARLTAGGSFLLSSGSRPGSYYQPFFKLSVPVGKRIAWFSEWRYYGFGEAFTGYENFHTNLITSGLRFTR